jgi:hypothetical protein
MVTILEVPDLLLAVMGSTVVSETQTTFGFFVKTYSRIFTMIFDGAKIFGVSHLPRLSPPVIAADQK